MIAAGILLPRSYLSTEKTGHALHIADFTIPDSATLADATSRRTNNTDYCRTGRT